MEQTIIYLSPEDARKFLQFQKNYELFTTLDKNGVFDMAFGKVTINVAFGEVQNVVKETMIFKK